MPSPRHLHVGAGRLGLGFVVPFFRDLNAETQLVLPADRRSEKNEAIRSRYDIVLRGPRGQITAFGCPTVLEWSEDKSALARGIPPAVLTCAVGPGGPNFVVDVVDSLVRVHADHYSKTPLLVIPFENEPANLTGALLRLDGCDSTFLIIDTVVDRICKSVEVNDGSQQLVVDTEDYWNVVLRLPEGPRHLADEAYHILDDLGLVDFSVPPNEFQFQRTMKAWAINGLHYALALRLVARHESYDQSLAAIFGLGGEDRNYAEAIAKDYAIAIITRARSESLEVSRRDVEALLDTSLTRLIELEETPARLVRGLAEIAEAVISLAWNDPSASHSLGERYSDFLVKWDTRVGDASRQLLKALPEIGRVTRELQLPQVSDELVFETGRLFSEMLQALAEDAAQ